MEENYCHRNRAKSKIRYHIILSTKYRKKCLSKEIVDAIKISFDRAAQMSYNSWHIETVEVDSSMKDHAHLLITSCPQIAPFEIIKALKQISTYDVWDSEHKNHLKKFYWSGKHYLWTNGYFVSTIGDCSERTIKQYIKNQG